MEMVARHFLEWCAVRARLEIYEITLRTRSATALVATRSRYVGDQHRVHFPVELRVRSDSIQPHATTLPPYRGPRTDTAGRVAASLGALPGRALEFAPAEAVSGAGALPALPALLGQGLLRHSGRLALPQG